VSIEAEAWRSESISAKGFIVMLVFGKVFKLTIANFTAVRRAYLIKAAPLCLRSGRLRLDRRGT